ncbi:hypothetical protein TRVL_07412 [Trypanosoma vivax]|nr:hypothetical protein TRVL_07412 [Trypanosoma vivax]
MYDECVFPLRRQFFRPFSFALLVPLVTNPKRGSSKLVRRDAATRMSRRRVVSLWGVLCALLSAWCLVFRLVIVRMEHAKNFELFCTLCALPSKGCHLYPCVAAIPFNVFVFG